MPPMRSAIRVDPLDEIQVENPILWPLGLVESGGGKWQRWVLTPTSIFPSKYQPNKLEMKQTFVPIWLVT